ncbi:MAG: outer membrane beta-barrel protein [Hyphomonas sp.]
MSKLKRLSLMSVAACALIAPVAFGQSDNYYSRNKYEAVLERAQPAFDPEPIRLGAFAVRPVAEATLTATDNVFVNATNEQSDVIARVGASVSGNTIWSVHSAGFDVRAYRNEYLDLSDESTTDLYARLNGRLDVTRSFSVGGSVFAEDSAEPRFEVVNDFGIDAPIKYTRTGVTLDANYQNDRVRWNNNFGLTDENYDDGRTIGAGTNIDQDYRDRSVLSGRTRLSYALSPDFAVFGQATYADNSYDNRQLIGGQLRSRDSKTYTVSGGVDFELTALLRGDIAVGYLKDKTDDAVFANSSGLSIDGRMQWFPTRLTTATFTLGRRVTDTGALDTPTALETTFGARVDHELRRNVILSGYGRMFNYDYGSTDREDETLELGAIATYKMNKRVHWEAFVRNRDRDVTGFGVFGDPTYSVTQAGIGVRIYP